MVARKSTAKLPQGIRARQLSGDRTAYDVRWTDARGQRQLHVCYDADEAIEYLADRRKEMRRGGHGDVAGGRMTLREYSASGGSRATSPGTASTTRAPSGVTTC